MKKTVKRRVSVPPDLLLSAAAFHSDKAEWWLRQEQSTPDDDLKHQDHCHEWYTLHRMWQNAIERAANAPLQTASGTRASLQAVVRLED